MTETMKKAYPRIRRSRIPVMEHIAKDRMLCQGMVPRALMMAAREEWLSRGMTSGRFLTWALIEYLRAIKPERCAEILQELEAEANG